MKKLSNIIRSLIIKYYPIISHPLFGIIITVIIFTIIRVMISDYILGRPLGYGGSFPSVSDQPSPSIPNEPEPSAPDQPLPSAPNQPLTPVTKEPEYSAAKESSPSVSDQCSPSTFNKPSIKTQAEIAANYSPRKTIRDFYHETKYSLDLQEKEVTQPAKDNPEQLRSESSHDYPE